MIVHMEKKNRFNSILKSVAGIFAAIAFFLVASTASAASIQVSTLPPTGVGFTTITLNGTYSGATGASQMRFEYGTTPSLGTFTTYQQFSIPSSQFVETLTGLTPGTTYYFRAEGIAAGGPAFGSMLSTSTTVVQLPQADTLPAGAVTSTTAVVNGWYKSTTAATVAIEYANNASFVGSYTSSSLSEPAGNGSYSITLTGLTPNTGYYYRATTTSNAGTVTATTAMKFVTSAAGGTTGGTTGTTGGSTGGSTGGTSGGTSGGTTGYSTPCIINSFYANQNSVVSGTSITLSWNTTNCSSVYLSGNGINSSQSTNGSTSLVPQAGTSTYTLTASGANGSTSSTVSVYASTNPIPQNTCNISNFMASPTQVTAGGSSTLSWNTQNCTTVFLVQNSNTNNGPNFPGPTSLSGSNSTGPLYTTTVFTLSANGQNGSQTQQITVSVLSAPVYPPYNPPTPQQPTTIIRYITGAVASATKGSGNLVLGSSIENNTNASTIGNNLAGLALWGGTFIPTSLTGILLILIIIMAIILTTRKVYGVDQKHDSHGAQAAHH
jgi:hypothetical protein